MTKDETKIIRLLANIQKECGNINFNTEHGQAYSRLDHEGFIVSLRHKLDLKTSYANYFYSRKITMICNLENTLADLKEYYKMNRIIVKKGES